MERLDTIFAFSDQVVYSTAANTITTIVQKSIRYSPTKKYAVYFDNEYFGTYVLLDSVPFRIKDLTNAISILFFGQLKKDGIPLLKNFKIVGIVSDNTEMALVSLQWLEYNKIYHRSSPS